MSRNKFYFVEPACPVGRRGAGMKNLNFIPRMFRLRQKYVLADPRKTHSFHSLFFGTFSPTCAAVSAGWRRWRREDKTKGLIPRSPGGGSGLAPRFNALYFIWIIVAILLTAGLIKFSRAETADHLVVSEVQITGGSGKTNNDFIEIYNPTTSSVDLGGWKLRKRIQSGTESSIRVFPQGKSIPAHGYFLWANSDNDYHLTINADESSSSNLASNNSIGLFNSSDILIDALAWGGGHTNPFIEGSTTSTPANPGANESLKRKPDGGQGNGEDNNDNSLDFLNPASSNPQCSQSPAEPPFSEPPPICDNDSVCESGENYSNCPQDCFCGNSACDVDKGENQTTCPADCPNNNGGGSEIYVPRQVEPGDILINEIFSEPNATKSEGEWIEFYNHTNDAALDLTGWTLEDNTAKPVILFGIILAPRQYYALDKSKFSFALNNGGDTLILKNNQVIIDQVAYGDYEDGNIDDNTPAPGLSKSIGRRTSEPIDTNNDKNDFSICQSVTPGRVNDVKTTDSSQPTAVSFANASVIISEFLPNPSGSDNNEWIELYNPGLNAVDLTGWQADDGQGGSSPYALPSNTIIPVDGYLILPWSQTKIVLNNNFDAVRLIRPDKTIQEQINYKDPPEGASYARDGSGSWEYTSTLTPGSANIFNVDDAGADGAADKTILTNDLSGASGGANSDLVEVDDLPQMDNGQVATIQGLVAAPPNLFAKSYFYLNGAQIYSFAAKFPDLQIGDLIEVKGIVSASFSGRRLKIKSADDIQVLGHQNLSPRSVAISELGDELIGHFLRISGQLVDKTGNKLYLDDNQEEVEVYLSPAIKWNKNLFTEGQNLQVSGILAEAKEGWRLLPRCDNDLVVSVATIDNFSSDSQNSAMAENRNNPSITRLASSAATVWQNLNRPAAIKYLFLSAGVIIIFLAGVFLKLRGVI